MRPWFDSWVGKIRWRRDRLPTPVCLGFPGGSAGKESACSVGNPRSVPGLGRSPGEGKGYPLQYSGLENSTDCIVHGVTKSQTGLSDFPFHGGWGLFPTNKKGGHRKFSMPKSPQASAQFYLHLQTPWIRAFLSEESVVFISIPPIGLLVPLKELTNK